MPVCFEKCEKENGRGLEENKGELEKGKEKERKRRNIERKWMETIDYLDLEYIIHFVETLKIK